MVSENWITVKDLRPFLKNIDIQIIVIKKLDPEKTGDNFITFHVADLSGSVFLSIPIESAYNIGPSDILRITGGYIAMIRSQMQLNLGKMGKLKRIGRYFMAFSEQPNLSKA